MALAYMLLTSFFTVSYVMFSLTAISTKMKVLLTLVSVTFHVPISGFGNGAGVGGTAVVVLVVVVGSFVVVLVGVVDVVVVLVLVVLVLAVVVVMGVMVVTLVVGDGGGPTVVEFGSGGCGGIDSSLPVHAQQRHNLKISQNWHIPVK
jgi:hypothetical protein